MSFREPVFWADAEDAAHRPYSVSEITSQVKGLLEENLPKCWVEGEISQYNHHSSGHRYFTLKDNASQLSTVMFKWQAGSLSFIPQQGMQVLVYGNISVFERGGKYQLYAEQIKPAGVGELAIAFEQLKSRLEAEGLFAENRKRPLPPYPRKIGVVTSPTGAAIRDIIQILDRRAPDIGIVLCPARVQGEGAAAEIAAAIASLNQLDDIDVLIVGRGGGAPEDLWPFNDESVARAIYQSPQPVISAVGHEIDYTIADYVADCRAPTPSAAAEMVGRERSAAARASRRATRPVASGNGALPQLLRGAVAPLRAEPSARTPRRPFAAAKPIPRRATPSPFYRPRLVFAHSGRGPSQRRHPPRRPQPAHEPSARFFPSGTRRQQTPRPRQQPASAGRQTATALSPRRRHLLCGGETR
jgi:exodeoxyribonuclease VII large subunit